MQRSGHQLLAYPAFSSDDHIGGRPSHSLYRIEDVAHGVGRADQITMSAFAADFLAKNAVLALNVQFFNSAFEKMPENVRVDRLDKVIVGPGIDYLQSSGFGFVRTEDEYKRINFASDQPSEKFGAFADTAITQGKT